MRRESKTVTVRGVTIGGGSRITVQSMTNADTADRDATLAQIRALERCGCDIVRFTVNSAEAVANIPYFLEHTKLPLVADIHFDYKLAIDAAEAGISKLRINPGNIGGDDRVRAVAKTCARLGVPVRVGVNGGSLAKKIAEKYGAPTAEALAESALESIRLLERFDFDDLVVSVKSSDVRMMIEANRILARECPYPLHLGVTEAGPRRTGLVKGAIGIGALLADGIGDTIRVSLTDDPVEEIYAAKRILRACGLEKDFVDVVSCPTCGRCEWDSMGLAKRVERLTFGMKVPLKVAVMGCAVNGIGEAQDCDLGIAGGRGKCVLFRKGVPFKTVPSQEAEEVFMRELRAMTGQKEE